MPKLQGTVGLCPQPTRQMPFWRTKAHMQEMSCALLSSGDERAYQDGDEMVGAKNDYLPSNCSHQTSDALKDKLQNLLQKNLFWKLKRDLPKRTGPFISYIRVIFTPLQLPARLLIRAEYQADKSLL